MKKLLFVIVTFLLCIGISAKEKNNEKEKEAIKKVITESTNAYRARDFNKIAATFIHDETLVKTGAAAGGYGVNDGWKKISENYKRNFKNNPETASGKFEKVNFRIKVYAYCAWSVHDEIISLQEGVKYKQVLTHFLEKHKGEWKIVYMANIRASSWDIANQASNTN